MSEEPTHIVISPKDKVKIEQNTRDIQKISKLIKIVFENVQDGMTTITKDIDSLKTQMKSIPKQVTLETEKNKKTLLEIDENDLESTLKAIFSTNIHTTSLGLNFIFMLQIESYLSTISAEKAYEGLLESFGQIGTFSYLNALNKALKSMSRPALAAYTHEILEKCDLKKNTNFDTFLENFIKVKLKDQTPEEKIPEKKTQTPPAKPTFKPEIQELDFEQFDLTEEQIVVLKSYLNAAEDLQTLTSDQLKDLLKIKKSCTDLVTYIQTTLITGQEIDQIIGENFKKLKQNSNLKETPEEKDEED